MDMHKAREAVALEQEVRAAAEIISRASLKLNAMGMEAKLTGWDWNRGGSIASLCPQGSVSVEIVKLESR